MKKYLLSVALIASVVFNASAQLTVYSSGKVGVGTSASDSITSPLAVTNASSDYGVIVRSKGRGIYAESKGRGSSNVFPCGVYGTASTTASNAFCSGVMGSVTYDTPQESGRAYGVKGYAGNASNGWNYAVFGALRGTNNGAGVYGSAGTSSLGNYIDGCYAGYFYGATKVKGDLTVTGSISGLILGQPSTATAAVTALSEYNDVQTVSDRLSTLSTTCYYIDSPMEVSSVADVGIDADGVVADSVMTESNGAEPNEIEILAAERVHYGIDVNTLKESFPELVYEKEDGTVAVNYMELIPVLVQAINELKNEVRILKVNGSGLDSNNLDAGSTTINISTDGRIIGTKKAGNNK